MVGRGKGGETGRMPIFFMFCPHVFWLERCTRRCIEPSGTDTQHTDTQLLFPKIIVHL